MGIYTGPAPLSPSETLDMRVEVEWQHSNDIIAKQEIFWSNVHEFWQRYDAGELQPVEPAPRTQVTALCEMVQMTNDILEEMSARAQSKSSPPPPPDNYEDFITEYVK